MTIMQEPPVDRGVLVYRHYEQLYRLALLVAGDADHAVKLVERAYRELPSQPDDAEARLIRALLPRRRLHRHRAWRAGFENLTRVALDHERAAALLDTLAALPTPARLAVGLHYLRGQTAAEVAELLGEAAGPLAAADLLTHFRIDAARAIGLIPAGAEDDTLAALDRAIDGRLSDEEMLALRRAVFERPDLRAARDGLAEARDLLARTIPALFATVPPPALAERLLKPSERRGRWRGLTWAQGGLAFAVLALAAAIVLVPSLLARRPAPALMRAPIASELIDAAIHRFDRAPLQAGVLHEQYRVQVGGEPAYLIERWYDYASPHRLAITVGPEGRDQPPLLRISSDGRSLVQYRNGAATRSFGSRSVDAHVSESEAQAALALLRAEPSAAYFSRARGDRIDIAPLYLAQARVAGAVFLGQTKLLGRPVFLLTYDTRKLPTRTAASDQRLQVVLTIDAQTDALLDVAVVAEGAGESVALHPLSAQVFEVAASAPDELWRLPTSTDITQQTGLPSARDPEIPSELFISLDDALHRAPHAILAPRQLPSEPMRGLALQIQDNNAERVLLIYEGEFQSILLSPVQGNFRQQTTGEERSAGDFRYRMLQIDEQQVSRTAAIAFRPESPDEQVFVILVDEYATASEREAALGQIIGSLTPVTEQNLPALRRNFYGPATAGGQ
ncbi:MAG TPA: hypothetical protein VGJ87_18825 [Roseiflexaceae bacterium]|jgi:hypothetical protein